MRCPCDGCADAAGRTGYHSHFSGERLVRIGRERAGLAADRQELAIDERRAAGQEESQRSQCARTCALYIASQNYAVCRCPRPELLRQGPNEAVHTLPRRRLGWTAGFCGRPGNGDEPGARAEVTE